MTGIWVKDGNGLRVDLSVLEPMIARIEAKVEAYCDPEDESYHRWCSSLKQIRISGDYNLLRAYDRLISKDHDDPRIIDEFVRVLFGPKQRAYRSLDSMTAEHVEAYWTVRNAIYEAKMKSLNGSRFTNDRPLYLMVFKDPGKARIMASIVAARGVIPAKQMRQLVDTVDPSATMLVDGLL